MSGLFGTENLSVVKPGSKPLKPGKIGGWDGSIGWTTLFFFLLSKNVLKQGF